MTVLVDTGVVYAHHDEGSSRHDVALAAIDAVTDARFGQPYVSDYVYDEAVTLTRARTDRFEPAETVGRWLRGAGRFETPFDMLRVTPTVFDSAVETLERYDDQPLSFTDATTVALVEARDIDAVLSFDTDFDGVVDRLDPAEAADSDADG